MLPTSTDTLPFLFYPLSQRARQEARKKRTRQNDGSDDDERPVNRSKKTVDEPALMNMYGGGSDDEGFEEV